MCLYACLSILISGRRYVPGRYERRGQIIKTIICASIAVVPTCTARCRCFRWSNIVITTMICEVVVQLLPTIDSTAADATDRWIREWTLVLVDLSGSWLEDVSHLAMFDDFVSSRTSVATSRPRTSELVVRMVKMGDMAKESRSPTEPGATNDAPVTAGLADSWHIVSRWVWHAWHLGFSILKT